MGLPRAIRAHAEGNVEEAAIHYKRALEQGDHKEILFQNYGAILKGQSKVEDAQAIYLQGLKLFPQSPGILRNYANVIKEQRPVEAIELYFKVLRILQLDKTSLFSNKNTIQLLVDTFGDIIDLFVQYNLLHWTTSLLKSFLPNVGSVSPVLLKNLILIVSEKSSASFAKSTCELIKNISYELAELSSVKEAAQLDFALADHQLKARNLIEASNFFKAGLNKIKQGLGQVSKEDSDDLQNLMDCSGWNYACVTLPLQNFDDGWTYFDHGLRTPAPGKQRWQRALIKPFSASQIPLWRGEPGLGKHLLLLEEQAIGDAMMFITLVPTLLNEFQSVTLFISPRLEKIYARSFGSEIKKGSLRIYTSNSLSEGLIKADAFDYQCPLGSICQYRFRNIDTYAPRSPILLADHRVSQKLRTAYLDSGSSVDLLVGISWKGGGRGKRIAEKSLDPDMFYELLSPFKNIRFIDLQYGNTKDQIEKWKQNKLDVLHDPSIDPLKDMNLWLSQVQACDAVLSVANTTIHGAGGLNLPTNCLLSVFSDWRWLVDNSIKRSYWYPSVGISRQRSDLSWNDAFTLSRTWLENGCPYPQGPISNPVL